VNQFVLEGEMFGVPGLVRWYAVRPSDGTLQWFDEKGAQDMFCSTTATKMLRHLKVKRGRAPDFQTDVRKRCGRRWLSDQSRNTLSFDMTDRQ
jgi:hypothetical protein